jgi:hypothetical protein
MALGTLGIVIVALIQAMVAKQSANAAISAERAWLIPTMQQDPLPLVGQIDSLEMKVANIICTVKNYGKTPCWITYGTTKRHLVKNGESLPEQPNYGEGTDQEHTGEIVLPPGQFVQHVFRVLPSEIVAVRRKEFTLYVYGCIRYRDAFERSRKIKFCYVYQVPLGLDLRPEAFYTGGPKAYHGST